ncbi:MAG TPA: tRNA preQ1(34) S-adenosylmethionine ribosyltransferase-isomerase QueA [Verrucomicrobiae bacterium]|nr:tRNA preQ1(34) S-adenosylmethionine ribosyltransferase-isomerase QueA [Verrucomicrobiae bacterium]
MRTADFNFFLPPELIAQSPAQERDGSRLLVLNRQERTILHAHFKNLIKYLEAGDLLVLNNSKVIPARLRAIKSGSGGAIEILLLEQLEPNEWWVMLKPGKRVRAGTRLELLERTGAATAFNAVVQEKNGEGQYRLRFGGTQNLNEVLHRIGEVPLPPYIQRPAGVTAEDLERYQTIYAGPPGSVAAPTAGLHFSARTIEQIRAKGVNISEVTLHVSLGTFAPIKAATLGEHKMHRERFSISSESAQTVNAAKAAGRRVIAIGTTSVRVLESAADPNGQVQAGEGETQIFIYPPYRFKVVDALLTNFHLPESTLLMLVSAFGEPGSIGGREFILQAYAEAVRERYRFFSYGDAMLIL